MKIQMTNEDGQPVFVFDGSTGIGSALSVGENTASEIANALHDAQAWLAQDQHVIASIKADIAAVGARIEHELGAHPAFTWAQTELKSAIDHLEQHAKGTWTEPAIAQVQV